VSTTGKGLASSATKSVNFVRTFSALEERPFRAAGREESRHAEAKSEGVGGEGIRPSARAKSEGRE
jgi:hypothetical protein